MSPIRRSGGLPAAQRVLLALLIFVLPIRNAFRFAALNWQQLIVCLVLGVSSVLWFELVKMWRLRRKPSLA